MKKLIACVALLVLCLTLFAACGSNENPGLTAAKEYLQDTYKNAEEITAGDFTRLGVVKIDGVTYTVEWTVSVTSGSADDVKVTVDGNMANIDVNEKAAADVVYTLTATIKDADGKTETLTYNHKVPAFEQMTWAEYVAAEKDAPVVVKGVVTAVIAKSKGNSYNCLYLNDADGGYYIYGMEADPAEAGIQVGMTVMASGLKDIYSGTHEVKNATVEIVDSNKTTVTAVDFTSKYTAAATLKDTALTAQQAMLVTVKGVEITGQDSSSGYYKFKLGDLESYLRISGSVCPLTKDEQTAFKNGHTDHLGWTANVTGVICVYNDAFYLTPVDANAIEYVSLPVKDDAGMVEFEKGNLPSLPANITKDTTEITLPTAGAGYNQVAITWTTDNACAVVTDGKLTITKPAADATVKVTATLTSGSASQSVDYTINVIARTLTQEEIVDLTYTLEKGESLDNAFTLQGVITKIGTAYSEEYKNITVTIQVGNKTDKLIDCYRLSGEGCENLKVGDTITVKGTPNRYNSTYQLKSCTLISIEQAAAPAAASLARGPRAAAPADPKQTVDAAFALTGTDTLTDATLTGVITKVNDAYSSSYGNITVTIEVEGTSGKKEMKCYRAAGDTNVDISGLKVGDTITITGTISLYYEKPQFGQGSKITAIVPGAGQAVVAPTNPKEIVDAAFALESGASLPYEAILTGKIVSIEDPYNSQYKNICLTIEVEGTTAKKNLVCYRIKGDTDVDISGLEIGDTITVKGTIKNHDGTVEFDNTGRVTKIEKPVVVPTDPKEIVDAAFALESGASLPYEATLTGKIVSIEDPYSSQHKNICLTIEVEGTTAKKNLVCYRIKGATDVDISGLAVGDTITVKGTIKNYNGTVEFDSTGRVTKIVKAPVINPSTGDFPVASIFAAMVLSAAALVVLKKKEN